MNRTRTSASRVTTSGVASRSLSLRRLVGSVAMQSRGKPSDRARCCILWVRSSKAALWVTETLCHRLPSQPPQRRRKLRRRVRARLKTLTSYLPCPLRLLRLNRKSQRNPLLRVWLEGQRHRHRQDPLLRQRHVLPLRLSDRPAALRSRCRRLNDHASVVDFRAIRLNRGSRSSSGAVVTLFILRAAQKRAIVRSSSPFGRVMRG